MIEGREIKRIELARKRQIIKEMAIDYINENYPEFPLPLVKRIVGNLVYGKE